MKIKEIWPLLIMLVTACATGEAEKIAYIPPEKVVLDRSAKDRAQTLTELGLAYYQLEKYNYALENLQESLKLDDKNAITYQIIALIKQRSNEPEQAQIYFDKALKLAPKDLDIVTAYAVFLYEQERHDEALIELNRVVSAPFYRKKWVAYSYLGLYFLQNDQQKQAEIKFYKALQIDASYSLALYETAKIRYAQGELMSARAYIERYFSSAGKTLNGLELAIKIETALQSYDVVEQYQLELKRAYPFSDAAEKIKIN
ncbi:hypothetical protein BMR07_11140 [Methylococcaceae bacterium CS1]|nr:hypothetical protein [Methyloprofundus sp.]TXK96744.1 hypothetical protein BMR10_06875 [Methylococcaceae bacterium CS4]TXL01096.1 hypothetical protein BMR11_00695 [Methylococcaceae bacterium CS5]TXL04531.1 hypothetical protein BMR09_12200 [Methylococcaceae bacterium CS3]TXL04915.1 hypothetical protein BMR07_11140 [Methylococcaceae bacterium CS1]TXL10617.1 hypothetical protein BMR08_08430 [Methylococcaceae bacterium CS2]